MIKAGIIFEENKDLEKDKNALSLTEDGKVPLRSYANIIAEMFENILDKNDITIPDEDREQEPDNEARLYGMTYCNLEDKLVNFLYDFALLVDPNCKDKLADRFY